MRARPGRRFAFRLAAHLGYTHRELIDRVSARELTEWQVFERIDGPLGAARSDAQTALLCAAVHNAACEKRSQMKKPADFLPQWDREVEQSPEQMLAAVKRFHSRIGGSRTVEADTA